jgi:anti-sigma factor RsiW
MRGEDCAEMRLLVQADVDGELTLAETARTEIHLEHCPDCAGLQAQILALGGRIRREVPPFQPPDGLLDTVRARLAMIAPPPVVVPISELTNDRSATRWRWTGRAAPFGGGFALAACLALALLIPQGNDISGAVVSDHIRALQPGHLIDVVSTDQHTVKPWFDGRLDFAPPVKDFKAMGFPLEGGRLEYLDGKQAAALIYKRGQHVIDLFVWPESGHFGNGTTEGSLLGYNYVRWDGDGMAFWAVSDLEADGLADFARIVRAN